MYHQDGLLRELINYKFGTILIHARVMLFSGGNGSVCTKVIEHPKYYTVVM